MLWPGRRRARIVGAAGICSHEASVSNLPGGDEPGLLRALHLAVHRRMWRTRQLRNLGETQLAVWIAEQERQDLPLLLRAQDRQKRRRRASIHKLKSTLQFVIRPTTFGSPLKISKAQAVTLRTVQIEAGQAALARILIQTNVRTVCPGGLSRDFRQGA
jgi:hypothetical protein